ncbi:hypothetical protein NBRC10513_007043 [Rhodotorula toruloides]
MPQDYLTSLPAELFDYIRDLVIAGKPKHPGAASHVNYLTLRLPETAFSSEAAAPVLRMAILHLRNVRQISITGAGELSKMLLSPTSPKTLPALTQLSISGGLKGWITPFLPRHYHTLRYYRRLYALDLHILRSATLRVLSLDSSFDCATILPLLAHELPHLTNLELEANESLKSQHLLRILSGPEKIVKLHTLSLSTSYGSRPPVHASLEPEGLFEVVELAKQEKVKVSGSRFWDAIKVRGARDARLAAEEEERREVARAVARRAARASVW